MSNFPLRPRHATPLPSVDIEKSIRIINRKENLNSRGKGSGRRQFRSRAHYPDEAPRFVTSRTIVGMRNRDHMGEKKSAKAGSPKCPFCMRGHLPVRMTDRYCIQSQSVTMHLHPAPIPEVPFVLGIRSTKTSSNKIPGVPCFHCGIEFASKQIALLLLIKRSAVFHPIWANVQEEYAMTCIRASLLRCSVLSFAYLATVLCFSVFCVSVGYAQALKDEWSPIGPWGGDKFEVYVDPNDNQIIYVVGANIFKSTDAGESWTSQQNPTEPTVGLDAYSLAFDPRDTTVLYLGTMNGVWKTMNGGDAWIPLREGMSDADWKIRKVLVDSENPDTIYASITNCGLATQSASYERAGDLTSAIYRSVDGGITWNPFSSGLPQPYTTVNDIYQNPLTGDLYAATFGDGFFVYVRESCEWQPMNNGLTAPLGLYITGLAFDPEDPDVMFVTTHKDWVYRTTTRGSLWEPLAFPGSLNAPFPPMAFFVGIDPNNPERVVVSALAGGDHTDETPFFQAHDDQDLGGLWISNDGGYNWAQAHWIQANPDSGPFGMTFDPAETLGEPPNTKSKILYAASGGITCVLKSTDGGSSFQAKTQGISSLWINALLQHPLDGDKLFATTLSVLHFSFDRGGSWSQFLPFLSSMELIYIWDLAVDPENPDMLYYATGNPAFDCPEAKGLYRLDVTGLDPGVQVSAGSAGEPVYGTQGVGIWRVYINSGGRFCLATQNDGILWSEDGGRSWRQINDGLDPNLLSVSAVLFDPEGIPLMAGVREADGSATSALFGEGVDGEQGALYRWDGTSQTWSRVAAQEIDSAVFALDRSPATPNRIYAATVKGIFVTEDGGMHWEKASIGLPQVDLFGLDLAIHPLDPNIVACASWASGAYVSTDAGQHWTRYSNEMHPSRVQHVIWDRQNLRTMYAASSGGSVWQVELGEQPTVDGVLSDGVPLDEPYRASKRELGRFQISIAAHDPDGKSLLYNAYLNGGPVPDPADNPEAAPYTFDPNTRTFVWDTQYPTSQNSPYTLLFEVSDGSLKTYVKVTLEVEPDYAPEVSLSLNQTTYYVGNTMQLRMGLRNNGSPVAVDLYISLRYSAGTGSENLRPIVRNLQLPHPLDVSGILLLSLKLPNLPPAQYVWHIVAVPAGADISLPGNWLTEAQASFRFRRF